MGSKILWAVIGGFFVGVLARSFFVIGFEYVIGLAALSVAFTTSSLFFPSKQKQLVLVVCASIACGAGILRMDSAIVPADSTLQSLVGTKVVLTGSVVDEPDVREASVRVPVRVRSIIVGSTSRAVDSGILVLAPAHTEISYGDVVSVTGTLRLPQVFDTGLGRQFDYPMYLAKDGIAYELAFAYISVTGENHGNVLKSAAIGLKHVFLRGLSQSLPEPEAGLAGGITVGDKRSIGKELSDDFKRVSLVHMVVLSGYNITVVINAIAKVTIWAGRYGQFGVSSFAVLFFILMSGGASSAMRAGAMALISMFARVTGRVYLASRALGVVAFCMVLWNPYTLAFDPSFQLSALATIGLMTFSSFFAEHLWWLPEKAGIREITASTLGTQLAVLPLLLYQNDQLSLVSLPANLLALIPVPFAMFFSLIAAIAGMFLGSASVIVGFPAYVLLSYIIGVARFFASLPYAAVSIPAFSVWCMIAAYVILFVWGFYIKKEKSDET